jgi:hypothetical protein
MRDVDPRVRGGECILMAIGIFIVTFGLIVFLGLNMLKNGLQRSAKSLERKANTWEDEGLYSPDTLKKYLGPRMATKMKQEEFQSLEILAFRSRTTKHPFTNLEQEVVINLSLRCLVDTFSIKIRRKDAAWKFDRAELNYLDPGQHQSSFFDSAESAYKILIKGKIYHLFLRLPMHRYRGENEIYFNVENDLSHFSYTAHRQVLCTIPMHLCTKLGGANYTVQMF